MSVSESFLVVHSRTSEILMRTHLDELIIIKLFILLTVYMTVNFAILVILFIYFCIRVFDAALIGCIFGCCHPINLNCCMCMHQ